MFSHLKKLLKKIVPSSVFSLYHFGKAYLAALYYGFPSHHMVVVGITGTKGKTSSSEFIWSVLTAGDYKTGLIGTAHMMIGQSETKNAIHMTMPSPWVTQKYLAQMVRAGCTHAVLEVSSEGLKQFRHIGIAYDIAVFTNLSPEHLPSHNNSFDAYKEAKAMLFHYAPKTLRKKIFNYKKISIINRDSEFGEFFHSIPTDESIYYTLEEYKTKNLVDLTSNTITIEGTECRVTIPGEFNLSNALIGYTVGKACGLTIASIKQGIENVTCIPGRMEEITLGQPFRVFIDYAHEKLSMENLLRAAQGLKKEGGKIIVLFGAEGGGRDKRKRKEMATITDTQADYVILSNVDPYDENPDEIIEDIARNFSVKKKDQDLFLIQDRREGIQKAFGLAQKNDIVLICGKGSEQTMEIAGSVLLWDERTIVREILINHLKHHD